MGVSERMLTDCDCLIHSVEWMDLSSAQQDDLIDQMIKAFGKPWADRSTISLRFFRPSCRVDYFTGAGDKEWLGGAVSWKESSFRYLDKFFVRHDRRKGGRGSLFLSELIDSTAPRERWVWRTDLQLATQFYHKHPAVRTYGEHGDYVYQGVGRKTWEYEDLLPLLTLSSAFVHNKSHKNEPMIDQGPPEEELYPTTQ